MSELTQQGDNQVRMSEQYKAGGASGQPSMNTRAGMRLTKQGDNQVQICDQYKAGGASGQPI